MKKIVVGVVLLLFVAGAGILLLSNQAGKNTKTLSPGTQQAVVSPTVMATTTPSSTQSAVREFTITAQNFSFTPKQIAVNKGDTVKITFKNVDGFHDFMLDAFQVASKKISAGQEDVVTFIADKAGSFPYYCSIGNHRAMGMEGTLTVK